MIGMCRRRQIAAKRTAEEIVSWMSSEQIPQKYYIYFDKISIVKFKINSC